MKFSILLYDPSRRRDYYGREAPPASYPPPGYYPPPYYYSPYPPPDYYNYMVHQGEEADRLARWIWYLVAVVIILAVSGVMGFIIWVSTL